MQRGSGQSLFATAAGVVASAIRTIATPAVAQRPNPADEVTSPDNLTEEERRHAARLMRVNHCGEVCAQALYQGQALFARDEKVREALQEAADEEVDHLAWTAKRIENLGGRLSALNPVWYAGSFALGAAAALVSDKVSLGFVAETENQVSAHLLSHLDKLPAADERSRAIVKQMDIDERQHATNATDMGGVELPQPVRQAMHATGRVMTSTSYWI
ncbi:MAG: 2-polyprenyl-3-methyl-6-methoxy-1,4-benzoquinone monooxygenase [Betaproteobacteria bacterium AqS2]|uniref:3-demethoxyubiquinol 3-hydroxylase n=1 Tax=Candidatus Amphirhobacter heronislandensis TaxID=1732024 RepID=A0A930UD30_9GAMM|nr:2-polyprenyl-3-methyl-6-methoxy-1,4-benzoquinone monooxygenase [Betaproteobacteria bacterium AqS2]